MKNKIRYRYIERKTDLYQISSIYLSDQTEIPKVTGKQTERRHTSNRRKSE